MTDNVQMPNLRTIEWNSFAGLYDFGARYYAPSSSSDKRVVVKMALDVFKNDGLWIAIMASDGLYHIQKAKITEEQHKKALYEFELLNNYGLKKEP